MTLLVGFIPTAEGNAALDWAVEQGREHGDDLVVANIFRDDALVEKRRLYDDQLAGLEARLAGSGVRYTIRRDKYEGDPAEHLLSVADEIKPEQIVIGLRRRSLTGKVFLGSTAQRIIMHADHPVTAVKAH